MLIQKLMQMDTSVKHTIQQRIKEFEICEDWFSELCYCILTANTSAKTAMKVQENLKSEFSKLTKKQLSAKLQKHGYRFYNKRAEYIADAQQFSDIKGIIRWLGNGKTAREWLVRNIKGLGYKEASHFLRNIGFKDVAIIDRHILNLLKEHKLASISRIKNRGQYFEIEGILEGIAEQTNMNLAELDLYLWYLKTGKVLK
ncbi:N-glycosylase/DNA lyase [archaeon]|nr:N-glycosylase/DNA lyase [archaeon]